MTRIVYGVVALVLSNAFNDVFCKYNCNERSVFFSSQLQLGSVQYYVGNDYSLIPGHFLSVQYCAERYNYTADDYYLARLFLVYQALCKIHCSFPKSSAIMNTSMQIQKLKSGQK